MSEEHWNRVTVPQDGEEKHTLKCSNSTLPQNKFLISTHNKNTTFKAEEQDEQQEEQQPLSPKSESQKVVISSPHPVQKKSSSGMLSSSYYMEKSEAKQSPLQLLHSKHNMASANNTQILYFKSNNLPYINGVKKWQAIVRANQAKTLLLKFRKEENRRENIVKEIYSTEVTYTNQLRSLSTIYFKELVESGLMEDSMKLIAAQLKGQVDVILSYSEILLSSVKERVESWSPSQCIGDVFLGVYNYFKVYTQYLKDYGLFMPLLIAAKISTPALSKLLSNIEKKRPEVGRQPFESCLILPVQRIPRYQMLLDTLAKYTRPEHKDYKSLLSAAEKIQTVATLVNSQKRHIENANRLSELQQKLLPKKKKSKKKIAISEPHRIVIKDAPFLRATSSSNDSTTSTNTNGNGENVLMSSNSVKKVLLYLMNDMILVTEIVETVNNDDDEDGEDSEDNNTNNNSTPLCGSSSEGQVMPIQRVLHHIKMKNVVMVLGSTFPFPQTTPSPSAANDAILSPRLSATPRNSNSVPLSPRATVDGLALQLDFFKKKKKKSLILTPIPPPPPPQSAARSRLKKNEKSEEEKEEDEINNIKRLVVDWADCIMKAKDDWESVVLSRSIAKESIAKPVNNQAIKKALDDPQSIRWKRMTTGGSQIKAKLNQMNNNPNSANGNNNNNANQTANLQYLTLEEKTVDWKPGKMPDNLLSILLSYDETKDKKESPKDKDKGKEREKEKEKEKENEKKEKEKKDKKFKIKSPRKLSIFGGGGSNVKKPSLSMSMGGDSSSVREKTESLPSVNINHHNINSTPINNKSDSEAEIERSRRKSSLPPIPLFKRRDDENGNRQIVFENTPLHNNNNNNNNNHTAKSSHSAPPISNNSNGGSKTDVKKTFLSAGSSSSPSTSIKSIISPRQSDGNNNNNDNFVRKTTNISNVEPPKSKAILQISKSKSGSSGDVSIKARPEVPPRRRTATFAPKISGPPSLPPKPNISITSENIHFEDTNTTISRSIDGEVPMSVGRQRSHSLSSAPSFELL